MVADSFEDANDLDDLGRSINRKEWKGSNDLGDSLTCEVLREWAADDVVITTTIWRGRGHKNKELEFIRVTSGKNLTEEAARCGDCGGYVYTAEANV